MSNRYVLIRDGVPEGVILWDGVTPYDPGPGVELVEEAKYEGPPPAPVPPPPDPVAEKIATLEAQMREVAKVPEVLAKVDLGTIKGARLEIAEPIDAEEPGGDVKAGH